MFRPASNKILEGSIATGLLESRAPTPRVPVSLPVQAGALEVPGGTGAMRVGPVDGVIGGRL